MWPILVDLGPIPIRTFGMTAALGFLLGLFVALHLGRRMKIDADRMQTVAIWIFIGIIGGGRLLFVLVEWEEYARNPIRIFKIWEGGLVLYGGLISAIALGMWQVKKQRLPFWRTCDLFFICGMLGLSLARVGCLCAGDDWGRVAPGISVWFQEGEYVAGTEYKWKPMHPGRAQPEIWALTNQPWRLYDSDAQIEPGFTGPAIDPRGYSKEPLEMAIKIETGGQAGTFRWRAHEGDKYSDPIPIPPLGPPVQPVYSTDEGKTWPPGTPGPSADPKKVRRSTDWERHFGRSPPPTRWPGVFNVPGTKLPWAIRFNPPKHPENLLSDPFVGEWLHPTQLYLSLNVLGLFFLLYLRERTSKRFDGELLALGMMIYPIMRSIIEVFRGDVARGIYGPLSTSQWVSIPWFALGVLLYVTLYRKQRRREARA